MSITKGSSLVFTLGAKETAYGPSALVAGAPFLQLSSTAKLSALTTLVDLSKSRTSKRCNLLVRHKTKGGSDETPSLLHKLCGKMASFHSGGQHFCSVHKQSMRTHADGGKILRPRRTSLFVVPSMGCHSHAPCQLRILRATAKR